MAIAVGATTGLTGSGPAEPRAVASDTTVGTGGSPAKDAIDRTKLPLAEFKFQGTIGKSYSDSKPDWPRVPTPPEGMPNVVVILLDDVGFGQVSTFGGSVPDSRTIRDAPSDKILKSLNISAPDTLGGIDHLDPTDRFQLN